MRICVFGAGAVGGHLAAKLAASGHDVSVVARGAHLEAMRDKGITLIHGDDTIRGRVRAAASAPTPRIARFCFRHAESEPARRFRRAGGAASARRYRRGVRARTASRGGTASASARERPRPPDLSKLDRGGKLARAIPAEKHHRRRRLFGERGARARRDRQQRAGQQHARGRTGGRPRLRKDRVSEEAPRRSGPLLAGDERHPPGRCGRSWCRT